MTRTTRARARSVAAAALAALAAAATACGAGPPRAAAPEPPPDPAGAAASVRGVVTEAYQSLRHGKREGVLPLLADRVYAVGPGPADVVVGRSDVVVALGAAFSSGDRQRLRSRGLRVAVAPGGRAAWASDEVDVDGVAYDATAVLAQVDGFWVAVAIHVSRPIAGRAPPARGAPEVGGGVDPGAEQAAALLTDGVAHPARLLDQLADSPDAIAIGAGARDVSRGARAIRRAWKRALRKHPAGGTVGAIRAGVTPDGALAWACARVSRPGAGPGAAPVVGRAFHVYERDRGRWRLVAAHESIAAAPR